MTTEQKPSRNEDEYFAKLDAELLKATTFFGSLFGRRGA
jgi:hypothetical protein